MDNILEALGQSSSDVMHRVIGNTFIVEMGIIKDIPKEGIVTVEMSATDRPENIVITNCVLASFAGESFSLKVKPAVDDKVLVLFPRKYSKNMFDPEENEPLISEGVTGYSVLGGIAILVNKFNEDWHKNVLEFSEGKMELKLAYSEEEDDNKFILEVTEDGEMELSIGENFRQSISSEGEVSLQSNNVTVDIAADDSIEIDNGKANISIDSEGNITIDSGEGKVSIKNTMSSLYDILNGMLHILNTSLATQGSSSAQTVVPSQFTQQLTDLEMLLQ